MEEHVILVAFSVAAKDRKSANEALLDRLPTPDGGNDEGEIVCWWTAEDDRVEGSDCDSAVFVYPGAQKAASQHLFAFGFTGMNNMVERDVKEGFEGKPI